MTTGRSNGVSTSNNDPTLLMQGEEEKDVENIVIHNDDEGSADGYWSVGADGELKVLDKGIVVLPLDISNKAGIYIHRKTGGSNLVNVRGYTLP